MVNILLDNNFKINIERNNDYMKKYQQNYGNGFKLFYDCNPNN